MDLVNPRALWLLPLIALLLLFARSQTPRARRLVANLYLWRRVPRREPARISVRKLRLHWLVALQAAFMLMVIAALARPAWSTRHPYVAFVVDVSASMAARDGATARLDLAKSRANAMRATLPKTTHVRLVAAGATPADLGDFSSTDAALGRSIGSLSATDGPAAISDAVDTAVSRADGDADVYVFTDQPPPPAGGVDRARWIQVGHPADNLAITVLAASRWPARPAGGQVLVEVRNYGSTARDTSVELSRDGVLVERRPVTVPAHASCPITVNFPILDGVVSARLTTDDALASDNRRWVVVPTPAPVPVHLVTRGSFFLEHALAADAALAVDVNHATDVDGAARERHDTSVLICDGCRVLPDARAGVLWIPPTGGTRPQNLEALALADPDHPIATGLEVGGLSGAALPRSASAQAGDVIVRAGSAPVVVAYEQAGRRVVELNLDLASSTLPLDTAFPVLLAHVIDWLSERDENRTTIVAGEPLHWSRVGMPPTVTVTVTGPDDRQRPTGASDREIVVADTSAAGIYHVRTAGTDRVFVVNPATTTESDLSAPPMPEVPAPSAASGGSTTARVEFPAVLLVAALLLLAVEWRQRCRGVTVHVGSGFSLTDTRQARLTASARLRRVRRSFTRRRKPGPTSDTRAASPEDGH